MLPNKYVCCNSCGSHSATNSACIVLFLCCIFVFYFKNSLPASQYAACSLHCNLISIIMLYILDFWLNNMRDSFMVEDEVMFVSWCLEKRPRGCVHCLHTISYKRNMRLVPLLLEALCICRKKQLFL